MLDAREYKLLLRPASVGKVDLDAANGFLDDRLSPIAGAIGIPTARAFDRRRKREVRFFDTAAAALTGAGFALRRRAEAEKTPEVTLKLRLPDLFVVTGTSLPGADGARPVFEEDIAPLEVMGRDGTLTVARPPSIRSRFAASTEQETDRPLTTVGDAFSLFPKLADHLGTAAADDALLPGPVVREKVAKGALLDLADGFEAELALTLWQFEPGAPVASIAEVSFTIELDDGTMSGDAARQALALFQRMQEDLDADVTHPSKTRLALPRPAG